MTNAEHPAPRPWWEGGVIYQIYPRSFQDTNGDGVGDLAGIEARLDHVAALGVDAIWLSPFYPSPMADFGYDVADYRDVDPLFGDLAAFDRLIAECHARGLKLLVDFVPNHTSTRHPWFEESRASRTSGRRDWYFWRDPAPGGGPPNNWISDMGGPAWERDEASGQYYLHTFLKEQADLDWRNPAVRAAMFDVLRFWLDRGVDGFRIDVLWHIVKAAGLPDNPLNPDWRPGMAEKLKLIQANSTDQPEAHRFTTEMRALADGYGERLLVGEIALPLNRLMRWYGTADRPEVQLPANFELIENAWDRDVLAALIARYDAAVPDHGWPNWVIGSHDAPRIAGRLGEAQARVAAMLLLTLRGTATLYQGDEIGIGLVDIPPDRIRDPQDLRQPGEGRGRDASRTPMAWDDGPHAGFSTVEPWLPLHDDWRTRNVAAQAGDAGSMLSLTRALLTLRRGSAALRTGSWRLLDSDRDVLAYERVADGERIAIALNLSGEPRRCDLSGELLLSTHGDRAAGGVLRGDEGLVIRA